MLSFGGTPVEPQAHCAAQEHGANSRAAPKLTQLDNFVAPLGAIRLLIQMDKQLHTRFYALGDATRFAVVERLLQGPASVSELAAPHPMALPPFMKHLRVLENAGLIQSEKQGRVRTCSIRADTFDDLDAWFRDRRRLWRSRLDRLETQLSKKDKTDASSS